MKILSKRDPVTSTVGKDFLDDLYQWALESVACLALNARLGCLQPDLPEHSHQMRIIRAVSAIFSNSQLLDNSLQLWRMAPNLSPKLGEFKVGYNTYKELSSLYIAEALDEIKKKKSANEEQDVDTDPTLLERFFKRGCDEDTAIVMAMDMMFAGTSMIKHIL